MTTVDVATGAGVVQGLRARVRDRLDQEYQRLCEVERPKLLEMFDSSEGGAADAKVGRALAIADYRIAALRDFLRVTHSPHGDEATCANCVVLLDTGQGPQWFLLAAVDEGDLPIIASDSALGRAVIGARAGQVVTYPHPTGPKTARVMAKAP